MLIQLAIRQMLLTSSLLVVLGLKIEPFQTYCSNFVMLLILILRLSAENKHD